jgi:hypothetical protein
MFPEGRKLKQANKKKSLFIERAIQQTNKINHFLKKKNTSD